MFDVALALQNLTLVAHSLGLGTLHVGWFDAKKAAEIIGVPEGIEVLELLPLGYPEGQAAATSRKDLDDIVFYEKYGQGKA
jgi:nitroreductase